MNKQWKTKRKYYYLIFALLVYTFAFIQGCDKPKEQKNQLLIYCGITMIRPIAEIAKIIEQMEDCEIIITKGGSGNLLKSLKVNGVGDLYLPGSDSYIKTCLDEGLVTETVFVGYNKAVIMVQKGNPKNITANLDNLKKKKYQVVIGNPNSGSIGKETKKILEKKGIANDVLDNASKLTTDSKDLVLVLKNKEADMVINWFAVSTWPGNEQYIDVLGINEEFAVKKKLVLGMLKTTKYPDTTRKFMEYAASDKGLEIFKKYGLYDIE